MVTDREVDAYLGESKAELIDYRGDQGYEDLRRTLDAISRRYPGDDMLIARDAASKAAAESSYSDNNHAHLAKQWKAAQAAEREAMAALTGAILWETVRGATQGSIVSATGAARATVAKAITLVPMPKGGSSDTKPTQPGK